MFCYCERDADPVLQHILQLPAFVYRVLCAVFCIDPRAALVQRKHSRGFRCTCWPGSEHRSWWTLNSPQQTDAQTAQPSGGALPSSASSVQPGANETIDYQHAIGKKRWLCEEHTAAYQKSFSSVQIVEVPVDQVGVFVQEVGVQRLHYEDDGFCIQLRAQQLGKRLWSGGGQQVSASRCVSAGTGCWQSLDKLVGISGVEVDADVIFFTAALRIGNTGRFLILFNLRTAEIMFIQCLGLKAGSGHFVRMSAIKVF